MFKPAPNSEPEVFSNAANAVEKNYTIQKNDELNLQVFSNNGEQFIDPNLSTNQSSGAQQKSSTRYLVNVNGIAKFPLIGEMNLEGLTIRQAEEIVQKEYSKFFKESFVIISFANKRVIVLGAPGGQVIPLVNQNVHVAEVLALAKGVDNNARADNIKLVRGTHVYQINFSTISGFNEGNILVEPNDIIYVEPIRRPFTEGLRDNYVFISLFTTLVAVIAFKL